MILSRTIPWACVAVMLLVAVGCSEQSQTVSEPALPQVTATQFSTPVSPRTTTPAEDTESITVDFIKVNANNRGDFVVLRLTNTTDKNIAGIRGSVRVLDDNGNVVRGYGYTDQLFNKAPGESVELPLLKIKPEGPLAAHRDGLAKFRFVYVAREITYGDK